MVLILVCFTLILLFDMLPIIRQHSWRSTFAFFLFFISSLTLAILLQFNVEVPSVMLFLGDVLKAINLSY